MAYYDQNGKLTNEKPATDAAWHAHNAYKKAVMRDPAKYTADKAQEQRMIAEQRQEKLEAELRSRYIRAGGDPRQWEADKKTLVKMHLQQKTIDADTETPAKSNPLSF